MDEALLKPLNQLETSLNTLISSLTTTNSYTAAPGATQSLLDADGALSSALVQLRKHQDNYTRILNLRAEADRLHTQLKDIVRTCVELRSEIGQIHTNILDDTDDDEEKTAASKTIVTNTTSKRRTEPVDYDTLLSFAARIGKHNAAAAIEAERQSNRRDNPETKPKPPEPNGNNTQQDQGGESAIEIDKAGNTTQESLAELAAINDTLAQQRAYRGMAFPAAEALRMGALGRLQYLREQEGEDAVEKEIERMVRDSERVVAPDETMTTKEQSEVKPAQAKIETVSASSERPAAHVPQQRSQPPPPPVNLPPKPKVALDLDFPGSDDDEDDD